MNNRTKVVTGTVRLSYANVWEPKSINGGKEKYSTSLIISKGDKETIEKINKAVDAAIEEGIGKFGGKKPNKAALKLPLRDGDTEKDDPAYSGSYFINAKQHDAATDRRRKSSADSGPLRSLQRGVRESLHYLLRLQHQRKQGRRLRLREHPESA
jgi:hypothetical protein